MSTATSAGTKRRAAATPDWNYLGDVAMTFGLDQARALMLAIAEGVLVDMGPVECEPVIEVIEPVTRPSVGLAREIQMRLGEA